MMDQTRRGSGSMTQAGDQRVLLVVLRNLTAPIELDKVFYIFSQFGVVQKISTFVQHGQNQVVVQFEGSKEAHLAMGYLNGRDLRVWSSDGKEASCSLAIVPSRLVQLTFRKDDSRNRDYTVLNQQLKVFHDYYLTNQATKEDIQSLAERGGFQLLDFLWGTWIMREGWLEPVQDAQYKGTIPVGRGLPEGKIGECVHLSGLAEGITAYMLWAVMGMYGELVAVKLLAQHQGCALIQYRTKEEAEQCIKNMNMVKLFGNKIYAQVSRNANATHWRGAQTELERRMCTAEDVPPPAPAPVHITGPPCRTVSAWGLPLQDPVGALKEVIGSVLGTAAMDMAYTDLGQGIVAVTLPTPEDAFNLICSLNGQIFTDPATGQEFKACFHFANDNLLTPPTTDLQPQFPTDSFSSIAATSTHPSDTPNSHNLDGFDSRMLKYQAANTAQTRGGWEHGRLEDAHYFKGRTA